MLFTNSPTVETYNVEINKMHFKPYLQLPQRKKTTQFLKADM